MEIVNTAMRLLSGRFYLPDGIAKCNAYSPHSPYDRLIVMIDGEKHEPMSLKGRLETVILHPGDSYLVRKYVWEYVSFSHPHRFLCIIPRGGYLRLVDYRIREGQTYDPWPAGEIVHTNRPPSVPLSAVFAALSDAEGVNGRHIPYLLRSVLSLALDECQITGAVRSSKSFETFEQICVYMERHFRDNLSRESIAAKFGLAPSYISQLFKEKCGQTFQEYLLECRISMAKVLLCTTSLRVKEIADRCGFSGEIYFVRRFREVTGIPPGRYRLSNKN